MERTESVAGDDSSFVPESCTRCPYFDEFGHTCSHPFRQLILRELRESSRRCPVFPEVRSEAMRDLERRLR